MRVTDAAYLRRTHGISQDSAEYACDCDPGLCRRRASTSAPGESTSVAWACKYGCRRIPPLALRSQKSRGTARFRGSELVSVCEIRPWKRHFGPLFSEGHFWCLVFLCVPYCPFPAICSMIGIDASHTIHAGEKFRSRAIAIAFGEPGPPQSIPRYAHGLVASILHDGAPEFKYVSAVSAKFCHRPAILSQFSLSLRFASTLRIAHGNPLPFYGIRRPYEQSRP